MAENLLSPTTVAKAKPTDKPFKLSDGGGLLIEVRPTGAKWWRWRYSFAGKEKMLSLGVFPAVSLADARRRRDEARKLVASGVDPSDERKAAKEARAEETQVAALVQAGEPLPGTFEALARDWLRVRRGEWAPTYYDKLEARLVNDVFPWIGARLASEITPPELLKLLRRIEERGAVETAHRVRDSISLVFRYGVATGDVTSDPARDVSNALRKHTTRHLAAITDPVQFGALLRAIDGHRGTPTVRLALKLAALVFQRPGAELREARWTEFDLTAGNWLVPAARMKRRIDGKVNGEAHLVPLARQAVEILRDELWPLTGRSEYVFPSIRTRSQPISENTLNAALSSLGYGSEVHRAHGFRAAARTMIVERLGIPKDVVEAQLAHAVDDTLGRAYNRTEFIEQRRAMMQKWADYCDQLRNGAQVIDLSSQRA